MANEENIGLIDIIEPNHTTVTIDPDAQAKLLQAFEERDINEFIDALQRGADPATIDEKSNTSVFEKALENYGCSNFVQECLDKGCSYKNKNLKLNKYPINFAADGMDAYTVGILLKFEDINLDVKYAGLTPINFLAKNFTSYNYVHGSVCFKRLLQSGADPNIPDQKDVTPILHIVRNKNIRNDQKWELITYFINLYDEVDLDNFSNGKARREINRKFLDITLHEKNISTTNIETLLSYLSTGREGEFISEYQSNFSGGGNQQNITSRQKTELLKEAIKNGFNNAVRTILALKVNINLIGNDKKTPIQLACSSGNWEALNILIRTGKIYLRRFENLVKIIIENLEEPAEQSPEMPSEHQIPAFCNFDKCFDILLDSNIIDINGPDESGMSPLHIAGQYKNKIASKRLLECGAWLGSKSQSNDIAIAEIDSDILKEHLNSRIQTNGRKPGDAEYEIKYNCTNFVPGNGYEDEYVDYPKREMMSLLNIAKLKDKRHLLNHPLFKMFLFMKWYRYSFGLWLNLIFPFTCYFLLLTCIFMDFNNFPNENVLAAFRIYVFFWTSILLYVRLSILSISVIYSHVIFGWNFIICSILSLITLSRSNYDNLDQRVLKVLTILSATVHYFRLAASLTEYSKSYHFLLLKNCINSFLRSISVYLVSLTILSLCLYILFESTETEINDIGGTNTTASNGEKDEDVEVKYNKNQSPFRSIVRTMGVFTGQFDAGHTGHSMSINIIVLSFILFIVTVIFNLLHGIATTDTQTLKCQAELEHTISRINTIASMEVFHQKLCYYLSQYNSKSQSKFSIKTLAAIENYYIKLMNMTRDEYLKDPPPIFNSANIFPYIGNYITLKPNDKNSIFVSFQDVNKLYGDTFLPKTRMKKLFHYFYYGYADGSRMDPRIVKSTENVLQERERTQKQLAELKTKEDREKNVERTLQEILTEVRRNTYIS